MHVSTFPTPRRFGLVLLGLLVVATPAAAADDPGSCELKIRGHSIDALLLIEKTRQSGVAFHRPGESVRLAPGVYRLEQVALEGGYVLNLQPSQRRDWFEVTAAGPNELVVGAPLYPTATATRYGRIVRLNYDTVDAAGRSYLRTSDASPVRPPPPTFAVYKDDQEIGSGSFEYG